MLAKFENGNFLEINVTNKNNTKEYVFCVYDEDGYELDSGWTTYRDIEMYYPKNLVDYILEFCEPDDVHGEYEILDCKTMEEYLPSEDENGKWILERQGDEDGIRRYSTFEDAQRVMKKEYEEIFEDHKSCMEDTLEYNYAVIGDEEFYQSWNIHEEKSFENPIEQKFYEIQMELDRADTGVSQYAFELMSTDVIRDHLYKVEKLINELKEMI